ncbi:hypothetical protein KW497_02560 [Vibrio fluvialis]|nr:hypothetical protein [Vibrio fluvialis]
MKKYIFLLLGLFTTSAIASADCDRAMPMTKESVHLVVEALRLHKRDASYQEIGQWRSKTFNPAIERIEADYSLTPQDMMNPNMELTSLAYNEVVLRSKIYVNKVFSYARGSATKESVNQQRTMINDAVGTIYRTCAPPKE